LFPLVAGNYFTKAAVEMALWDWPQGRRQTGLRIARGKVREHVADEMVGLGPASRGGSGHRPMAWDVAFGHEGEGRSRRRRRY